MSETDPLPNIQRPLLSQSIREVNSTGMHFYHVYNYPVQALCQIHHSVVLEGIDLLRGIIESQVYGVALLIGNHCAQFLYDRNTAHGIKERVVVTAVKAKTKSKRKLKTVVKAHWMMATLKKNCRKSV